MVPIAVVGLSGRFPAAHSAAELWRNLLEGVCAVGPVPVERARYWDLSGLQQTTPGKPVVGGFLSDIERFDAAFFGITAAEAAVMDPQQRMLLEESWRAFEDAGYAAEDLSGKRCAVFVGSMMNEYHDLMTVALAKAPRAHEVTGVASYLAGRIAYHLDLRGPALAIDTASSASLAAVHLACRALQSGEVDMALAGGVSLFLTEKRLRVLSAAGIITPEDRCRPFDEGSQGTLAAEGIATVVLKRLDDALADGDAIHGVIRGTGMNQSGRAPGGITVPSVASQVSLMRQVYREAQIDPATLQYVEAHGTGTPRGDPIEAEALATAIAGLERDAAGRATCKPRATPCYLGAIKSNIGHAFAAAGMGGLIKLLLAMQHRTIPPQLNFTALNRNIHPDAWPFTLTKRAVAWLRTDETPRRAALSGIGLSGTNCHCVVDESPAAPDRTVAVPAEGVWIVLSSRTATALRRRAEDLLAWLREPREGNPATLLVDLAYTLSVGRTAMTERLAFIARALPDVVAALEQFLAGAKSDTALLYGRAETSAPVEEQDFSGAGAAWVRGAPVAWRGHFAGAAARRMHLPTYPFEGMATWYDLQGGVPVEGGASPAAATPSTAKVPAVSPLRVASSAVRLKALSSSAQPPAAPVESPPLKTPVVLRPAAPPIAPAAARPSGGTSLPRLRALVARTLFVPEARVQESSRLVDLGLDSILAVELTKALRAEWNVTVSAGRIYDYPTVAELAGYVDQLRSGAGAGGEASVTGFAAATLPAVVPPPSVAVSPAAVSSDLVEQVRCLVSRVLFVPAERVGVNARFTELGLDSILAVELTKSLRVALGVSVSAGRLYDYASVAELAGHVAQLQAGTSSGEVLAVTGFAAAAPVPSPVTVVMAEPAPQAPVASSTLVQEISGLVADTLFVKRERVNPDATFADLGLDSILAVELTKKVAATCGASISTSQLYDLVSPRRLAGHIAALRAGVTPEATAVARPTSGFEAGAPVVRAPVLAPTPMPAPVAIAQPSSMPAAVPAATPVPVPAEGFAPI
ncbi:MAG TPA: beta-ketoacyl synthase N-terminal-like domain-containing protein, partial [Opitutaceae bacterium]